MDQSHIQSIDQIKISTQNVFDLENEIIKTCKCIIGDITSYDVVPFSNPEKFYSLLNSMQNILSSCINNSFTTQKELLKMNNDLLLFIVNVNQRIGPPYNDRFKQLFDIQTHTNDETVLIKEQQRELRNQYAQQSTKTFQPLSLNEIPIFPTQTQQTIKPKNNEQDQQTTKQRTPQRTSQKKSEIAKKPKKDQPNKQQVIIQEKVLNKTFKQPKSIVQSNDINFIEDQPTQQFSNTSFIDKPLSEITSPGHYNNNGSLQQYDYTEKGFGEQQSFQCNVNGIMKEIVIKKQNHNQFIDDINLRLSKERNHSGLRNFYLTFLKTNLTHFKGREIGTFYIEQTELMDMLTNALKKVSIDSVPDKIKEYVGKTLRTSENYYIIDPHLIHKF
ncbi:hypothetical protein QTN25_010552 [Entamoeba marina]